MKKFYLWPLIISVLFLTIDLSAQTPTTPLDEYLDQHETIVVAKCTKAGPINILLRSLVELDVIHIVKGDPKLTTLSLQTGYGMEPGQTFLVRVPKPAFMEKNNFGYSGADVVPVSKNEDLALLKTLSTRIVVLRTMNLRIDHLDSIIRRSTSEMEALKAVKKGN